MNDTERVKIMFPLSRDHDDYPPADWEHLWAIRRGDLYEIDNIPFFVRGVSSGDLVSADRKEDELVFNKVVKFAGHSTLRVVMYDLNQKEVVRAKLVQLGCELESSHLPKLFAVDVPPLVNYPEVVELLSKEAEQNVLDYEEASIQHGYN